MHEPGAGAPVSKSAGRIGRILDGIDRLSDWGAWAAAACIFGILGLIVGEVVARNTVNVSFAFAWEFSSYLMGAAFLLGSAHSLRSGSQIRVMALLESVPPWARRALDLIATLCAAVAVGYLACALAQLTWLSWTRGSRSERSSELPLWIAQAPMALGAFMFTLQAFVRAVRLLRGEPGEDVRLRVGQDAEAGAS